MGTQLTFLPGCSAFSLPGAWPSTDSLEETLRLPTANTTKEEPPDTSCSEGIKPRSVSNAAGEESLRNSVATYDDDSDDFYSFVEAQENDDAEVASSPDPYDTLAVPIKVEIGGSIISENPGTTPTSSDSGLGHTEDTTSSEEKSPSQMMFALETSISSNDGSNCTPPPEYNHSHPTFLIKDTPRTPLVASSSRSIISESGSTSSGSARLGDEEFSHHLGHSEDESAVNHPQLYGAIDEVHFSNDSEESLSTHALSSSPPARQRSRIQRRVIENHDSQLDILHLAQPDGHNPWTLSLDPALVDLSELATASRTSVSVDSSSVAHDASPPASPESRLHTPVPPQTPTAPQSFSIAQSELRSNAGLGRPSVDLLPPHYPPPSSYSTFSIPHSAEKRGTTQKPKTFYQKMKRLFLPKSSKQNENRGINEMSVATPVNASLSLLPFSPQYANESSSQWSLNRRTFQRSAKSSAPSVALSCTPDIPYNSTYHFPPGAVHETRRTFEYRRPSISEGAKPPSKRNRRFSVPTPFYTPSVAPSTPSSSRNISIPSSRLFGRRGSRVGESEH